MSNNFYKAAKVYGKAIFNVALTADNLEGWFQFLNVAKHLIESKSLTDILRSKRLDSSEKVKIASNIIQEIFKSDVIETQRNLLFLLITKKRFELLNHIFKEFNELKFEHEKKAKVIVESAIKLADEDKSKIEKIIAEAYKKSPEMDYRINEALIGGICLKIDDIIIDQSIASRLKQLNQVMTSV